MFGRCGLATVTALIFLAAGLPRGARAAELPALPPGGEVSVSWDGLKRPLIVRVPDGYTADRDWPVIFHFHGTGGDPTIDIPRLYTGGRDFILVGMEYVTRDQPAATPDYLDSEWTSLLAVRDALATRVRLDVNRMYVGGFSQGGWFASEFMEVHGRDLAGAYVLGAGKRPRNKREPKSFGLAKPVYLGAGQLDLNYVYAVQGIKHFGSLGGTVTFDDFLGLGHRMPMGGPADPVTPSLEQWFRVEALRGQPESLRAAAAAWGRDLHRAADGDADPLTRWLRLSRARRAPFHAWLTPQDQAALADQLATLERRPEFTAELRARTAYFSLVERELRGAPDGNLWTFIRAQAGKYHDLWQSAPAAYHGRRAAMEFARLRDQMSRIESWRFPDEAAKAKALADSAAHPLPPAPPDDVLKRFKELRVVLDGKSSTLPTPTPAPGTSR